MDITKFPAVPCWLTDGRTDILSHQASPCVSWGEGKMGRNKRFVMEMQIIVVNQQKEQRYEVIESSKRVTKLDYLGKLQKIFQFTGFY